MAVTLSDVARKAGVSMSTVSRVLNHKGEDYRISADTQERIFAAAEELRYRPNYLARGLRLKKTNTLGLITPDVTNPFFAHIVKCIQEVAHSLGYGLLVCNTDEDLDLELEHIDLLFQKRVEGLIAMPVGQRFDHFQEWLDRGRPLVLLDRFFDQVEASSVVVDNYGGAREAVEYLISLGHRRIAIIQGLPDTYTSVERLRGYKDALAAHSLPVDEDLIVGGDFRRETGYVETKLVLQLSDPPTALFPTSDLITLGALQAIEEEGLSIPGDVSLVAFDDFDFAPFLKCPLTAVQQPKEMMGEMAVRLLVDQLQNGGGHGKRMMLKPKIVIRESACPPRT
jgi:LacI family transcriptional regulator